MYQFHFTEEQRARVLIEARRRIDCNASAGLVGKRGGPTSGSVSDQAHFYGCAGEMAVAGYLGLEDYLFLETKPVADSFDLPGKIEVKTRLKHSYDLLIPVDDNPEKLFVLVTIWGLTTLIQGWALGSDVMLAKYLKSYRQGSTVYSIPKLRLNPISTLRSHLCKDPMHPLSAESCETK